jgi:hypothetical protein
MLIAKGHMLANALLCPDLEAQDKNFKSLAIYLDTPLVLNLLNLQGTASQDAAKELVTLCGHLGARLAVFEHTVIECRNILEYASESMNNARCSIRVVLEARRAGRNGTDLKLISGKLEHSIRDAKLHIDRIPSTDSTYSINEARLRTRLDADINYAGPNAAEFDVNSVRGIYLLRRGHQSSRLEDTRAVLATLTGRLVETVNDFHVRESGFSGESPVVFARTLANHAWLKAPMGAPNLPQTEILAFALAAMEPSDGTWNRYLDEIDKLQASGNISSEDHVILRSESLIRFGVADLHARNDNEFEQDDVIHLLDSIKSRYRGEAVKEAEIARCQAKELVLHADSLEEQLAEYRDEREALKRHNAELLASNNRPLEQIYWISERLGGIVSSLLFVPLAIIVVLSAIACFAEFDFVARYTAWWWCIVGFGIVVPVLVGCGMMVGFKDGRTKLKRRIAAWIQKKLVTVLNIEVGNSDSNVE